MASWFESARFGMFIHWGHCSQHGRELSWPLVGGLTALPDAEPVSVEDYHASAKDFCPKPGAARTWMRLARQAGMRYAVFTTKHHDGFAMFPTRHSEFSITGTPYEGDLVREYVDAARAEGLRVGFYFSLSDWHHPDYPAFTDDDRPYPFLSYRRSDPEAWARYREFMFGVLRELLIGYGQIDVLWFDGGWERTPEEWDSKGLHEMIRSLQPGVLINDRLPGFGDYATPEQFVPARPPSGPWETCLTMNRSWGYVPADRHYKSARDLVHALSEVASRGGNLLLNVSPSGEGSLPGEQVQRLETIGAWMDQYGEAIIDTDPGLEPWQFYGPTTRKGDRIFLHLLLRPYETVTVRGIRIQKVRGVRHLGSGIDLDYKTRCAVADRLFNPDPTGEVVIRIPESQLDPLATVLVMDVEP
ncbi:MAG: alpha-L-fucosidase [Myxococcota bacterium]